MVRSTASGYHLDDMLDFKLRQASIMKGSVSSCLLMELLHRLRLEPMFQVLEVQQLQSPDLSGAEDDSASVNATVASAAVGSANTGSDFTLGTHSVAYKDLPLADGGINLYDMVQGYCAVLATAGDSKPCTFCGCGSLYSLSV